MARRNGDFPATCGRPREQQAGDVGAGDEQDDADDGHQHEQRLDVDLAQIGPPGAAARELEASSRSSIAVATPANAERRPVRRSPARRAPAAPRLAHIDMPVLRPRENAQPEVARPEQGRPSSGSSHAMALTGMVMSATAPTLAPTKPRGLTPTIVAGTPLMSSVSPTACGLRGELLAPSSRS